MARKQSNRFYFEGYLVERGAFGWYVCDWDYEGDGDTLYRGKSKMDAINWICRQYA